MCNITLSPPKNEQLYKTGTARGDAWLRRISVNNLLPLRTCTITAMFNSLWTTLKTIGSNPSIRPSVNPFITSFRPRLSQKKCMQLYLACEQKEHLISGFDITIVCYLVLWRLGELRKYKFKWTYDLCSAICNLIKHLQINPKMNSGLVFPQLHYPHVSFL